MTASSLTGRSVLVTGSAGGLGLAVASECLEAGASVVVFDVDAAAVEAAVASLAAGGRATGLVGDVTSSADCEMAVSRAEQQFGHLSGLVNNAAVLHESPLVETTEEMWDRVLDVNVGGAWKATRAALPAMLRHGGGAIVNVASVDALIGQRGHAAYAVSKAGLVALTRVTAAEHARHGIRCNAVCPGTMSTPMLDAVLADRDHPDAARAELTARIPGGAVAEPVQVAAVAVFLLGPGASYMNGAHVVVDGGRLAAPGTAISRS